MCKVVFAVLITKVLFQGMKTYRYLPNSEWEIVENTATRNLIKYDCCPHPYGDLTFNLTLRRKVSFQLRLMLLPTLLLSTISLFMFWIPAHRPDRTALGRHFLLFVKLSKIVLSEIYLEPNFRNLKFNYLRMILYGQPWKVVVRNVIEIEA